MNRRPQALILAAIGGVAMRLAWTGEYARYVNEWMRWPLLGSGLLLVVLALVGVAGRREADDHPTTSFAWLLLVPILVAFVINPPALGSYVAERRANDLDAAALQGGDFPALPEGEVADVPVSSFVARAAAGGESLAGREVRLTGFVSRDDAGSWYVTRLSIACCAADGAAFRVRVEAAEAPADEQWVEVTGTWVEGTTDPVDPRLGPAIAAADVTLVDAPRNPYE